MKTAMCPGHGAPPADLAVDKRCIAALVRVAPPWLIAVLIVAGVGVNVALNLANTALGLPFFFDSIGTATVAALFGPLPGVLVALCTNPAFDLLYRASWIHSPFALCGAATAAIVGLVARSGRFVTLFQAVIASLLVCLANSVLGAVIATFVFGGITGVAIDYLVTGLLVSGRSLLFAAFWARVPANLVDKTIAVAVAFFVHQALQKGSGRRHRSAAAS